MNAPAERSGIYIVFGDEISPASCKGLLGKLMEISYNAPGATVHLLLNSIGGSLASGLALYNHLRMLPLDLVTVNCGHVGSVANLIFLAGNKRIVLSNSHFFFHDFNWTSSGGTDPHSIITERTLQIDAFKVAYLAALKERTKLFSGRGKSFNPFKPAIMDSRSAATAGIASIGTCQIPENPLMLWAV